MRCYHHVGTYPIIEHLRSCAYPERGGGGRGSGPPPTHTHTHTLKNHKNIGFLSNTSPDPLKITKLPSQQMLDKRSILVLIEIIAFVHAQIFK